MPPQAVGHRDGLGVPLVTARAVAPLPHQSMQLTVIDSSLGCRGRVPPSGGTIRRWERYAAQGASDPFVGSPRLPGHPHQGSGLFRSGVPRCEHLGSSDHGFVGGGPSGPASLEQERPSTQLEVGCLPTS